MRLPAYCPLKKNFSINKNSLIEEIDTLLQNRTVERSLPFENGKSIYDQEGLLKIASDEDLNDTTRYRLNENLNRVPVLGKFKTYHVFNLTYLEEEPDSLIDIYRNDDPDKEIFWHKYKKPFLWREEFSSSLIRKTVEQFPWEYVQGVRLIYMSPPSIGQVHRDSHPLKNQRYYKEGNASITLNINTGGGTLNYLEDRVQKSVDNDVDIFHFNDSVPHGVTPIKENRYQIRIWGKLSVPYQEILELDVQKDLK